MYSKQKCYNLHRVTIKTEPTDDIKSIVVDNHIIKEPPLKMIKLETNIIDDRSMTIPIQSPQPLLERSLNAASPADIVLTNNRTSPMMTNAVGSNNTAGSTSISTVDQPKYCNICDIKFNYLNTFIAHKKFYCKNSDRDIVEQSSVVVSASTTPTNSSRGTETPVL